MFGCPRARPEPAEGFALLLWAARTRDRSPTIGTRVAVRYTLPMKSALVPLLVCLPTLVVAQSDISSLRNSGTDYVRVCGAAAQGQSSPNAAACGIWLTGVMDGLQAYNTNMRVPPLFDAPNVATAQVAKLLINYVTSHPQQASLPASALVLAALVEAYPSKQPATPPKN